MRVLIAGAGIGGLTAALALHARGIEVQLCEAALQIQPLGVGINILPHAMAVLDELGAADEIAAQGVKTRALLYTNRHGQTLWSEPRGLAAGYPVPQVSIHRGQLQQALLALVQRRLGAAALRTGVRVEGFETNCPDGVQVRLATRDGRHETVRADLLVAADGIHSEVRRYFYPDEGPPQWSGAILWRAISLAPPFLSETRC